MKSSGAVYHKSLRENRLGVLLLSITINYPREPRAAAVISMSAARQRDYFENALMVLALFRSSSPWTLYRIEDLDGEENRRHECSNEKESEKEIK